MVTRGIEVGHTCGVASCRLDIWNDCLLRLTRADATVRVLALRTCVDDDRSRLIDYWLCKLFVEAIVTVGIGNLIQSIVVLLLLHMLDDRRLTALNLVNLRASTRVTEVNDLLDWLNYLSLCFLCKL